MKTQTVSAALDNITAVIINYRTPDLTERAVRSFRAVYPGVRLLLIDNGSGDESLDALHDMTRINESRTDIIANAENRHHGPAMDQALHSIDAPLVLFLDSDCEVLKGGFLEKMVALIEVDRRNYAVGKRIFMNDRGFDVAQESGGHPYIRPICMLIRRDAYLGLPPFRKHGAPCLENFVAAERSNLALIHFPVEEYVRHEGRGTAMRHGYGLGLRGRINHLLNKFGL